MQMLIAQTIVQITLEYLSKQPYKEVAGLIMELQKLVPYVPPKDISMDQKEGNTKPAPQSVA